MLHTLAFCEARAKALTKLEGLSERAREVSASASSRNMGVTDDNSSRGSRSVSGDSPSSSSMSVSGNSPSSSSMSAASDSPFDSSMSILGYSPSSSSRSVASDSHFGSSMSMASDSPFSSSMSVAGDSAISRVRKLQVKPILTRGLPSMAIAGPARMPGRPVMFGSLNKDRVESHIQSARTIAERVRALEPEEQAELGAQIRSLGAIDFNLPAEGTKVLYFIETAKAKACAHDFFNQYVKGNQQIRNLIYNRIKDGTFICVTIVPITYEDSGRHVEKCLVSISGSYESFEKNQALYHELNLLLQNNPYYEFCMSSAAAYQQTIFDLNGSIQRTANYHIKSCAEDQMMYDLFKRAKLFDHLRIEGGVNVAVQQQRAFNKQKAKNGWGNEYDRGAACPSSVADDGVEIEEIGRKFTYPFLYPCEPCENMKKSRFEMVGYAMLERAKQLRLGEDAQEELVVSPVRPRLNDKGAYVDREPALSRRSWRECSTPNVFSAAVQLRLDQNGRFIPNFNRQRREKTPFGGAQQSCCGFEAHSDFAGFKSDEKARKSQKVSG